MDAFASVGEVQPKRRGSFVLNTQSAAFITVATVKYEASRW